MLSHEGSAVVTSAVIAVHLGGCARDSKIKAACAALAGNDARSVGADPIGHRIPPLVKTKSAALKRRAVTAITVCAKQRLDIAGEINLVRSLGGQSR